MAAEFVAVRLDGLDALNAKLATVTDDMRRKGGRFALRKAAQVIRKAAQERAATFDDPETGRSIAQNITERWNSRLFKRSGNLGFRIGVQGGAKTPRKGDPPLPTTAGAPTPHWRLVEFGTEKTRAQPFMRPAADRAAQPATDEFVRQYSLGLDRALRRAGK